MELSELLNPAKTGRALPFSALQQRLGRKKVSDQMMRRVPVAYLVFDVLYAGGELLIDRPLRERAKMLDELLAAPRIPIQARSGRSAGPVDAGIDRTGNCRPGFPRTRVSSILARRNSINCSKPPKPAATKD